MQSEFWHERWQRGELGWHIEDVNPLLERYWSRLGVATDAAVLVPLCGKSRDLLWLAGLGHPVIGIELSAIGAEAFFTESGLTPTVTEDPPFRRYRAGSLQILCGDFFDLEPKHLPDVGAVYDRGALVALPVETRNRYVAHVQALFPAPRKSLVITFDYPQQEMDGPPFSVGPGDIETYFGASHRIETLAVTDALAQNPHFRERGVTRMREIVFALDPERS